MNAPLRPRLGHVALAVCLLPILFAVFEVLREPRVAAAPQAESPPQVPDPVVDIPWRDVNAQFSIGSPLTDLAKTELWKKYEGKRVRWMGPVDEVYDTGMLTVTMDDSPFPSGRQVHVRLLDSERATAVALKRGEPVTFVGNLETYSSFEVWLSRGVLDRSK